MSLYNAAGVLRAMVAQGAAGTTVLAAASPGNKHKIIGGILTLSAAGTLKFNDGADLTGPLDLAANSGFVLPHFSHAPFIETAVNSPLNLVTTAGRANGVILYVTEP